VTAGHGLAGGGLAGHGLAAHLRPAEVLSQMEAAVVVIDRIGSIRYANPHAGRLFGVPGELAGRSFFSLGFEEGDLAKTGELLRQVHLGSSWEGMLIATRPGEARVFVQVEAVPMRDPSGAVDGVVLFARQAAGRAGPRERDQIALLDRIGEQLSRSLELDLTLRHVAEMLVPQLADCCVIDLFQGDKLIRRALISARGWAPPGSWARVGEQVIYPDGHVCQQAMALLDAVVVTDLRNGGHPAPAAGSLRASEEAGLTSIVAAPLCARGELLGVMSLGLSGLTGAGQRRYGADDRDLLGAIAGRIAIAIDNAMLFEEERRTALAFQTSLLPQQLPTLDGLEVAWRYVPAKPLETHGQGIQTQVGGDWYDLIPLSAGRVGIVIGDVEGRGARAAAVMGQLRAAMRAFAHDDKPPAEMLRKLDDWCRTLGSTSPEAGQPDSPIVSCTYLVYDAWTRTLSFANAGHDAPLLITGGEVGELEIEHKGLLLGVRGKGMPGAPTYHEETRHLPPGSTLVLYTDGLTDRRHRRGGGHYTAAEALAMLRAAVGNAANAGVEQVAQAAEEAVPGDIDDDMAIVVVRTARTDLALWECSFPAEAIRVSEARRQAQATLARWQVPAKQAELICLLISEVVTNVVLHTALPGRRRFRPGPGRPGQAAISPGQAAASPGQAAASPGQAAASPGQAAASPGQAVSGPDRVAISPPPSWAPGHQQPPVMAEAPPLPKQFTLRLRRGAVAVWVEVFDSDLRLPRIRSADETDEGGRGLFLVDQLASRWGSRPTKDGKAVWFEMPVGTGAD
jgi:PAS domain S-box-containing protein